MSADDFASLPTRRITWLYIFALSLVALLTLTGQVLVQWSLSALQGDSTTLNIAGRQRMLSQRIPRLILALDMDGKGSQESNDAHQAKMVEELERSLNVWRNNHLGLVNASSEVGLSRANSQPILDLFSRIEIHFKRLEETAQSVIRRYRENAAELISLAESSAMLGHSDAFLTSMDAIVAQYELESKQRVSRLQWIERGLLIATLIVLLCEGIFIFSPAIASLKRAFERLKAVSNQLELAKQSAEQANSAKTQFLTQVNHELRTPLHAIIGMLDLMRRGRLTQRQKQRVGLAYNASNDLRHLVDDLLDISSVENRSPLSLQLEKTDIARTVQDCIDLMQQQAKRKRLNLNVINELPGGCECLVDSYRLRQILINLIQNAIRYTSQGKIECRMWIETDPETTEIQDYGHLNVAVRDTGCGIAPENYDRIFQNFVRINPQGTSPSFGPRLGLGLPITASLVAAMNGTISVESAVGKGSRFLFRLPTTISYSSGIQSSLESAKQFEPSSSRRATATTIPRGVCALVVDDAKVNRRLLREYLARLGVKSFSTNSASRAMQLYKRVSPQLIVLDLHLGDETTLALARSIRSDHGKRIGLLYFITADCHFSLDNCPADLQVAAILRKPIEFDEFRSALLPGLHSIASGDASTTSSDPAEFDELRSKLRSMVRQKLPDELRQLNEAFDQQDFKMIQLIAHRLRGAASNAGWMEIADVFAKIEISPTTLKDYLGAIDRIAMADY